MLWICHAQTVAGKPDPKVGEPMPYFKLQNVFDYNKTTFSLQDANGKWLVLAFWYRGCGTSVKMLRKFDELYKSEKTDFEFMLIGRNDRRSFGEGIVPLYNKLKKIQSLQIPHTFDSVLCDAWSIWNFPRVIIVDPGGIVRHITTGEDLTAEKLRALVNGEQPKIYSWIPERPAFRAQELPDSSKMILHRSTLTRWNGEAQSVPTIDEFQQMSNVPGIRLSRVSANELFRIAFMGRRFWYQDDSLHKTVYPQPVIEVSEKAPFESDFLTGSYMYNYELVMPMNGDVSEIMRAMQNDLMNHFQCSASFEERMMPAWSLTISPKGKRILKTKRIPPSRLTNINGDGGVAGFAQSNLNMNIFLELVTRYINDYQIPYFDDTDITFNFDIEIDALMTDRQQVLNALAENGMNLVLVPRMFKVLVITDIP